MYKLKIDKSQTIVSLQKAFNDIYKFLRIGFFAKPHKEGEATSKKYMITGNKMLSEIQAAKGKEGVITFDDNTRVIDFENEFRIGYGLYVQLFRKSGNIWLEITNTDHWTLKQQNDEGQSLEKAITPEPDSPDDHDIY